MLGSLPGTARIRDYPLKGVQKEKGGKMFLLARQGGGGVANGSAWKTCLKAEGGKPGDRALLRPRKGKKKAGGRPSFA